MSRRTQGSRGGGFGLFLLASQIMQIGVDRIPPVTLLTVAINAVIYMRLVPGLPGVNSACTSNINVLNHKEWKRIFLSSFYHLDDMHLYYNMISFIWKGIKLERDLGKRKFFILIAVFSVGTQVAMLALNHGCSVAFQNTHYLRTCAAGFSAVIFALKVVTTALSAGSEYVMGLPISVPTRYACWVELVVIQLLVPNASFTGHLAGILVGLLYVYGPLKYFVKVLSKISGEGFQFPESPPYPRYNDQRSTSGYRSSNTSRTQQPVSRDDEEDELLQQAIRESLSEQQQQQPPPYGWHIPSNDNPPRRQQNPDSNPPRTQHNRNDLYPDLTQPPIYRTPPSAPPVDDADSPYPPASTNWNAPYSPPVDDHQNVAARRPLRVVDDIDEPSIDDVRSARLRRFENKS